MKKTLIVLSLLAFVYMVYTASLLLHNLSPSLRVVEDRVRMPNMEAKRMGYTIRDNREYYRKIVYEERRQTKGLSLEIRRDTTSNEVFYEDQK